MFKEITEHKTTKHLLITLKKITGFYANLKIKKANSKLILIDI
jgi:hypothetical protein